MNQKALKLCSRFALTPNQLGYCGSNSASKILTDCILKNKTRGVKKELRKFLVLFPYLQTIAQITNLEPFSYEVIEAYWFGSDLLKKCKPEHYDLLLKNFKSQGVPDFLLKELEIKKPKVFIPIHLFNILHVGVGRATGSVPFNLNTINNCMIRWGKIKSMTNYKLQIKNLNSLSKNSHPELVSGSHQNSYNLKPITYNLSYNPKFTPNLKIGDTVAVHWNFIQKKLTTKETKNLKYWTKKLISSV